MKRLSELPQAASFRRWSLVAAVMSIGPILGSCVSAVDESSAFGFQGQTPARSGAAEAAALPDAAEDPRKMVKDEGAALARLAGSEPGEAVAQVPDSKGKGSRVVQTASVENNSDRDGSIGVGKPLLTQTSAMAAYATAVGERQADHSLYASLFNESKAKTPLPNADAGKRHRVIITERLGGEASQAALPGVDPKSLFEIGQRASADSEDLLDDLGDNEQIASLSGMARLAPTGLLVQRADVDTSCFDPKLVSLLHQVESKFGKKVVITSGYRSPDHNRRVHGAKRSMHMACKAADLQIPGVSGVEIARYVRALPERGGVGTYCHTSAIHIDTGRKRDWNWTCRRRQQSPALDTQVANQ